MKRILAMIALAALTIGLAGSCSKNLEERLDKTDASVADIKAAIGQYENLMGDITAAIEALRAEVGTRPASEQKTIWDCINALQNQKGTFEAAIAALNALVGDEAVSVQIDEAIAELISDYHLDGLAADIQAIRDKLNEKSGISALADQVAQLQKRAESIARILSVIGAYEEMIQSVRINPASADGSVKAEGGILKFTFTVTPATALDGVKNLTKCLKLYANEVEVKTKAGGFAEIPVTKAEVIDKANGEVSVEANVSEYLPAEKTRTLSVALNVRTGVSNYTTEFVTVSNYIPDYLPGFFTVNGEGKQVRFSKGNLQATYNGSGYTFGFAANQYDYIGDAAGNTTIDSQTYGAVVDLFCWSTDAVSNNWGIHIKEGTNVEGFTTGNFKDWGKVFDDKGTWRTLTKEEWYYLFYTRNASKVSGTENARYSKATVNGIEGMILLPETYVHPSGVADLENINNAGVAFKGNSYDLSAWTKMESAGAVFLPAASYRQGSGIPSWAPGSGRYWTTSNFTFLSFNKDGIDPKYRDSSKTYGYSVRLVMDVE